MTKNVINENFSKYSVYIHVQCMSASLPMSTGLVTQLSSTVKLIQDRLAEKRSFCHSFLLYRILVRHPARLKVSTIVHLQYWATYKVDSPWCSLTWTKLNVTKHPLSFSSTSIIFPTCHSLLYHTATYLRHLTFSLLYILNIKHISSRTDGFFCWFFFGLGKIFS